MTRSKRMKTIVNLADNQKDSAARQLGQSQQMLEKSQQQLVEMNRCRVEYAAQLEVNNAPASSRSSAGVRTASELQGIRVFMQQLDVAIKQLERQVLEYESVNQKQLDIWMKLRNKSRALTDIKIRYQKSEEKILEQREQFEIDELSQRGKNES